MVNQKYNQKSGFSLFEVLLSMLILSLFFIASSKVITKKQEVEIQKNPHGYYECYISGGNLYENRANSGASGTPVKKDVCVFFPPKGVNFMNVHYYDGNKSYSSQQVLLNEPIKLREPSKINQDHVFFEDEEAYVNANSEQANLIQMRNDEFKSYLELAHPNSQILRIWQTQGTPPESVFIAW